jgi:hypothetical protein
MRGDVHQHQKCGKKQNIKALKHIAQSWVLPGFFPKADQTDNLLQTWHLNSVSLLLLMRNNIENRLMLCKYLLILSVSMFL